ncbi:MAG: hypothetical protein JXQ23_07870, partial [Clostridia bacterium]|nr:hypothetical protein [Clostridia bacterium]
MSQHELFWQDNEKGRYHIGLKNINSRVKLKYGDEYGLNIDSIENTKTTVTLTLPIQWEES